MGYSTDFSGSIQITPPLNPQEVAFINQFADTRRMDRKLGPYFIDQDGNYGQNHKADILDYNSPPEGQPGLWCQWEAELDGSCLKWNGAEKFYNSSDWMAYLLEHFICEVPAAKLIDPDTLGWLPGGHTASGVIYALGEEYEDAWRLIVEDGHVFTQAAENLPVLLAEGEDYDEEHEAEYDAAYEARLDFLQSSDCSWHPTEALAGFGSAALETQILFLKRKHAAEHEATVITENTNPALIKKRSSLL